MFLDKTSSRVAPILVRLYDSHRLYSLAKDRRPLARAELTSVVVDLFNAELSPREQELITDVLIGLMRQAEVDLRRALSERLSAQENVPLRMVLALVNDDMSVARPLLHKSKVLSDLDLIYIIKSQGPEYWQAIAARMILSDHMIDVLADTRDRGTVQVLAENAHLTLTEYAMEIMAEIARESDVLARPLLARPEVPESIARKLYKFVGRELKSYIKTKYPIDFSAMDEALDDIILEFTDPEITSFMPSGQAMDAARALKKRGELGTESMIEILRRGQISSFVAQFSVFTDLKPHSVIDVMRQNSGQGLAIVCKARGIEKSDFVNIYLLTQRMRTRSRIVNEQDLALALKYFVRVKQKVAERILSNSAQDLE